MSSEQTASVTVSDSGSAITNFHSRDKAKDSDAESKDGLDEYSTKSPETNIFSSMVAAHYNSIESKGLLGRGVSRIYYLRNFNNWIKCILIKEATDSLNKAGGLNVLDMCCGKGGDFFKWTKLNTNTVICADIAEKSLEEYKNRIRSFSEKWGAEGKKITSNWQMILADCTRVRLRSKFQDPSIQLDLVSCQFSFHYCFESLPQAECMLKNASECLKPGGYFIGTLPNAYEIVKRVRKSKSNGFSNKVFSVEMCCSEPYELFGAKYNFQLEGVVNCPEFLVHFPTFTKLAAKFGLKLIKAKTFDEYFEMNRNTMSGHILIKRVQALETYPPRNQTLLGPISDYSYAKLACEMNNVSYVGTISKSEWEVITLYKTFMFQKVKSTLDANGYPQYEF